MRVFKSKETMLAWGVACAAMPWKFSTAARSTGFAFSRSAAWR
ncbi:expressed unknown protein [Ectocarpus siliculosus]|uniref:Uncharacterized protein n=1 Tax=Ectocarpus siliculosus TaxID=2880 RepID=D8LC99_ECTSI|nr:expressed unknown protein [Ectocarpus siliculosus]|eukprot:CBN78135.1 expressed unknown protein [Ectocarpus siliculosus]